MPEVRVRLSALWVALMFTYLLGDELALRQACIRHTHGRNYATTTTMFPNFWPVSAYL